MTSITEICLCYLDLKKQLMDLGYESELDWIDRVKPPTDANEFASQIIHVIVNSGMKAQIAEIILNRIYAKLRAGLTPDKKDFGHEGKLGAIKAMWREREENMRKFNALPDAETKLEFCKGLPWIGDITKYHLARNLGVECCKPDRHLCRIATMWDRQSPHELCGQIKAITGDKVSLVDAVLWRAANLGMI